MIPGLVRVDVLSPLITFEPLIYFTTWQPTPRVCCNIGEPAMERSDVAGAAGLELVEDP